MIISPYATTVGKLFLTTEKVPTILKSLELRDELIPTTMEGVFSVDHQFNGQRFSFPLEMTSFSGENIVVFDNRPYMNKSNKLTNKPESDMMMLASFLIKNYKDGDKNFIKNGRSLIIKGFVGALASSLARRGGLNTTEEYYLKIILTHYWVCITEPTQRKFITIQACKSALNIHDAEPTVNEIEEMQGLGDLLREIKSFEPLFKLSKLDMKDFLTIISRLSFSAVGKQVIGAAAECPPLMMAIIYAVVNNNIYNKTPIGIQLSHKNFKKEIDEFNRVIGYKFDMRG